MIVPVFPTIGDRVQNDNLHHYLEIDNIGKNPFERATDCSQERQFSSLPNVFWDPTTINKVRARVNATLSLFQSDINPTSLLFLTSYCGHHNNFFFSSLKTVNCFHFNICFGYQSSNETCLCSIWRNDTNSFWIKTVSTAQTVQ